MTEQIRSLELFTKTTHDQYKTPDPKLKNISCISTEEESLNKSFLSRKKEREPVLKEDEDEDLNSTYSMKRIIYSDQKVQKICQSSLKLNDLDIKSVTLREFLIPSPLKTYHLNDLNFKETLINYLRLSKINISGKKFQKIKITKYREHKEFNTIICDEQIISFIEI